MEIGGHMGYEGSSDRVNIHDCGASYGAGGGAGCENLVADEIRSPAVGYVKEDKLLLLAL